MGGEEEDVEATAAGFSEEGADAAGDAAEEGGAAKVAGSF